MRTRLTRPGAAHAALILAALAAPAAAQVTSIGLSSVRAVRFGNEGLVGFDPQAGDAFAYSLAVGDFNGDGADDLATGIPFDDGITGLELENCGGVVIRYGIPGAGLNPALANQFLRQTPDRDPAEAFDRFGWALAACDFNDDSFDDLAVGVPEENYAGFVGAGAVNIYYGSASGLHNLADAFYTQSTAGIPGDVEDGDVFGYSLACGDFDGDDFDDLAIGVPSEDFGEFTISAGMVDIVPGSAAGLAPIDAYSFDQDSPGVGGDPEDVDSFGESLAAGDFNGDGFDDLAIGVPNEDIGDNGNSGKGQIHVLFGSFEDGLRGTGSLFWSETFLGGLSEEGDHYGQALAAGDFDGDTFDDLAIGIPFEDFGPGNAITDTGQVAVIYGDEDGFDLLHTQFWSQDNVLGAGTSQVFELFGFAISSGDFDRDGFDDIAVGSHGEFVTGTGDGAVTVWMGTAAGLSNARHRALAAGGGGFPGNLSQHSKSFGRSLAAGDFDGDAYADLAIGAPFENANAVADVGAVYALYGALFADGFETGVADLLWTEFVP